MLFSIVNDCHSNVCIPFIILILTFILLLLDLICVIDVKRGQLNLNLILELQFRLSSDLHTGTSFESWFRALDLWRFRSSGLARSVNLSSFLRFRFLFGIHRPGTIGPGSTIGLVRRATSLSC